MYITDDGIRLNAKIDMPKNGAEKCPLCIIIHGFTGHMEERHIIAAQEAMNEVGFATLRVEMYGHGNSDGEFKDHTLYKWLTNAMAVMDYAKTLDFVTDIYVAGHSQGGLTAMLLAGMERDKIKALLPLSPALVILDGARKGNLLGQPFDPDHIPDELFSWDGRSLSGNYVRAAQTLHVEEAIEKYDGPVLIVHGDEDEAVPVQYSIDAAKLYKNCKLVLIPGDTHCYDNSLEKVTDAIKSFLTELTEGAK
ncbi:MULTISPECIES: alpha/beta hydrolase [unclassified Butyrivibrio]|uniref:alpha/beta hydrolase n=1 Tax=unclassified Butyrivibrio TaxID=2639466 RepID=UPI00041ECF0F|nr:MULTISPECIES: alpha/beta fold hydrolase [unclassified Butyrivibrio]